MRARESAEGGTRESGGETWVLTDLRGEILEASGSAAAMLSVTAGHLRQRSLLLFFSQDRPEWNRLLGVAARGETLARSGWIRPRDRRPRPVTVELSGAPDPVRQDAVIWRFTEAAAPAER
jgi:hypothetical protein